MFVHPPPAAKRRAGPRMRTGGAIALAAALVVAVVLGVAASSAVAVQKDPPRGGTPAGSAVFPPTSTPYGMSYAVWSAAWWEFTLTVPNFDPAAPGHPPNCRASRLGTGNVYFLVGIFSPTDQPIDCTLPEGAALFLPVLNVDCSSVEEPPFFADDLKPEDQQACATALFDTAKKLRARVDHKTVPNLGSFRVVSPQFTIAPLPADNRLGVAAGLSGKGVADGVYLMVRPLSVGTHTIHIEGVFPAPLEFALDTDINLTVSPG